MTIEFDPQCGTAQSEDVLRLLIPVRTVQNSGYGPKLTTVHENLNSWIELKKFSGASGWPSMVLVLPGENFYYFLYALNVCICRYSVRINYLKCLLNIWRHLLNTAANLCCIEELKRYNGLGRSMIQVLEERGI